MNLLKFNHNITSLFLISYRIYQKNFTSILLLTAVLVSPAFIIGLAGWAQAESIIFFLSVHLLEAAIALGIIGLAFGNFFQTLSILRIFRTSLFLGALYVAIIQYLLFIAGIMGLTLPFPLSIIVITLWLCALLVTSMAQSVLIIEGVTGIRALVRSMQLARTNLPRVFSVVVITTFLQFVVFAFLFALLRNEFGLLKVEMAKSNTKAININFIIYKFLSFSNLITSLQTNYFRLIFK